MNLLQLGNNKSVDHIKLCRFIKKYVFRAIYACETCLLMFSIKAVLLLLMERIEYCGFPTNIPNCRTLLFETKTMPFCCSITYQYLKPNTAVGEF